MAVLPIPAVLSTTLHEVSHAWVERLRSLLEAPSPAVLTTYRKDASAHTVRCGSVGLMTPSRS
jgi:hypothetical protein